jgi:hypothetical protein
MHQTNKIIKFLCTNSQDLNVYVQGAMGIVKKKKKQQKTIKKKQKKLVRSFTQTHIFKFYKQ